MQLTAFSRWHPDMLNATPEQIETFLDTRKGRDGGPLARRTRYCWLSNLDAFYKWAVGFGIAPTNPVDQIIRPRLGRQLPRPISDANLTIAIGAADRQMGAWLHLGAFAGFRCCEIARLTRDDVNDDLEMLRVKGKGRKERMVPLHPDVAKALRNYRMPSQGHIFRRPMGGPYDAGHVSRIGAEFFDACDIDATMHQLRHWFGTRTYAACKDLRVVQELMGHSDPAITALYADWSREDARSAVGRLGLGNAA